MGMIQDLPADGTPYISCSVARCSAEQARRVFMSSIHSSYIERERAKETKHNDQQDTKQHEKNAML